MPGRRRRPRFRLGDVYAEELDAAARSRPTPRASRPATPRACRRGRGRRRRGRARGRACGWPRSRPAGSAGWPRPPPRSAPPSAGWSEATVPVADEVRDTISARGPHPGRGPARPRARARRLPRPGRASAGRSRSCPADAPAVVRLHPDDLAEIPAEALAELPGSGHAWSATRASSAPARSPRPAPARIDAQLDARPGAGPGGARRS